MHRGRAKSRLTVESAVMDLDEGEPILLWTSIMD